jgi:hypothetical protein
LHFEQTYQDATEEVLQRWRDPIHKYILEKNEINEFRLHFQKLFHLTTQPKASDLWMEEHNLPHLFFTGLSTFLDVK